MAESSTGRVIVISGPSGAGKTTVVKELLSRWPRLRPSVSATTRAPRQGEVHGADYWFLSPDEFAFRRQRGDFLECFEVFGQGAWYGTLADEVATGLNEGKWVLLEIDVQGTIEVLGRYPDAVTIFLVPESLEELERRLRSRQTDSEADIQRRLNVALREISSAGIYQYRIVNRSVEQAVAEIGVILAELE